MHLCAVNQFLIKEGDLKNVKNAEIELLQESPFLDHRREEAN